MPIYKVRLKQTTYTQIYVEADDELRAQVIATTGPIEVIKQKEGFLRITIDEKPTKLISVKEWGEK